MKNDLKPSILLLIFLIGFPQISETIYSPSLPAIATYLGTSNAMVQWTLSVYFIGFAVGQLCWGYVSDHIGRRPTMLLGILIYMLGSLGCLFSTNIAWLMGMRMVQAFGASVGSIITMTIIRECYQGHERNRLFSVISMALSSTSAAGPLLGGYLSHYLGWHSNFVFLCLMGIMLIAYSYLRLPETYCPAQKTTMSFKSIVKTMITDRHILACAWVIAVMNGVIFSFWQEAPFVFTDNIAINSSKYGYVGIAIALASYFGAWTYKRLLSSYTTIALYRAGLLCCLASAIAMLAPTLLGLINQQHPILSSALLMGPMMLLMFFLVGFVLPHVLSHAMDQYHAYLGRASAIFGFTYYIGISGFTWMMGYLHNGTSWIMPLYFLCLISSLCVVSRWIKFEA